MSSVIDFLERMGQDARLRHASRDDLERVLASAKIDQELQAAILAKDQALLEVLLGNINICCMVDPSKEDEGEDEDAEDSPSHEGEELSTRFMFRAMDAAA
jgi:hypothetical protein